MLGSKFYAKKDDLVTIIAGKEKGKTGKILKVIPKKSRVVVENINFIKKHLQMKYIILTWFSIIGAYPALCWLIQKLVNWIGETLVR